jgi:hypothetical protein
MCIFTEKSPMPTEASLLVQIAANILTAIEQFPESSSSIPFLKETARKLLQDATFHLSPSSPSVLSTPDQGNSPPQEAEASPAVESVASYTRRDFTRWAKSLGLPTGHQFYTVGGGQTKVCFKLVWGRDGKALLETTCPDGVILRGMSPTGILKAYLKKTTGKEANVDGWKRLSMRSPNGLTQWPIRETEWMNYHWADGKFVSDEKGIHA